MSDFAFIVILALLLCCPAHAAEPIGQESWRPTERQCATKLEGQCHYANCSEWLALAAAHCTVERLWPDALSRVRGCHETVYRKRWAARISDQAGSPVGEIIRCATGH